MVIAVKISVKHKGNAAKWLAGFEKRMQGPRAVKVGFPAGKTGRHPGGLVDIVQIAIWNHFGTKGSQTNFVRNGVGGFGGPIPPRPFITIAVFKHRAEIRKALAGIYRDILAGKTDATTGLSKLGMFGAGIIQKTISQGVGLPNSPLTIAIKGSSKPLVDDGHMRAAVTWALDDVGAQSGGGSKRSASYRAGQAFGRGLARLARGG